MALSAVLAAALVAALDVGCGARSGVDLGPPARPVDAAAPDAAPLDATPPDATPPDGAPSDAAVTDASLADGAPPDAAPHDAAPPDAALWDGAPPDLCVDADGDGHFTCAGDCDDADARAFPGAAEVCDGRDQDCDGRVDDGVLSACGDCRPGCRLLELPGPGGWDTGGAAGLTVAPDGALTLTATRDETYFAWIANHLYGTLTKLDTRTGRALAEYDSVLVRPDNHPAPPGEECAWDGRGGNCPSRTAVDLRGAVYVANRAFGGQGTVTKIAGFESDCVDRNRNGRIDTSRDVDGDGRIDRARRGEFLGQADECLLWTVDVGRVGGVPRAIAVAADGHVWVGLHGDQLVVELDPATGRELRRVSTASRRFAPYGAAIDSRGTLWLAEVATGRVLSIDTRTGSLGRLIAATGRSGCSGSYGIAVDRQDRVWVAGLPCEAAFGYEQGTGRWREVRLPGAGAARGIAADADGNVWVASSHEWLELGGGPSGVSFGPAWAQVFSFRAEDGSGVRAWSTASAPLPGAASIGVGLDAQGRVWLVNQDSDDATRLDPRTGERVRFPVGESPYTYSDFTGYALRTFTAPAGSVRRTLEGCAVGPSEWERVRVDGSTPPGSRIEVRARTADRVDALTETPWIGPFSGAAIDLGRPPGPVGTGRLLELEIALVSADGRAAPRLRELTVQLHCPL